MSNETEIEDVTPVDLPEETVVEDTETVKESTDEGVVDEVVAQAESLAADIKTKIKGMPETDDNNVIGSSRTKSEGGKKFGKINKGYNIFPKDVANKWLKRNYVRLATPEEVAEEYGI